MSEKYTPKAFFLLESEYEKLTAQSDKTSNCFNRISEIEKDLIPCAKYLAEHDQHADAIYWLCGQRVHGTCQTGISAQQFEYYLNQASDQGHTAAMRLLGRYYYGWERVISVRQIRKNKALELFEKAAGAGDRQGRYDLACALCESQNKEEIKRANSILNDLMDEGMIPSFYAYYFHFFWAEDGLFHGDEQGGFEILNRAVSCLDNVCVYSDDFHESAIYYYIGLCFYEGAGCDQNTERAVDFMRRSTKISEYGDAYFWLKNKGVNESASENKTDNKSKNMPENMPEIFKMNDAASDMPDEDDVPLNPELLVKLDKPLSFIDIKKGKKQEKEQRKKQENAARFTKDDLERVLKPFEDLIGLDTIKDQVTGLFYTVMADDLRRRKGVKSSHRPMLHMAFTGNPGTGKTTVARLLGKVFKELGYLKRGHVVEVDRSKMVGAYIGHSEAITTELFENAKDGVLFIDEAYELEKGYSPNDFGGEVLAMLVKKMEDDRSQMVVIMAGYREEMSWMLDSNTGLRSRLGMVIDFPDYTDDEKARIFEKYSADYSFKLRKDTKEKLSSIFKNMEPKKKDKFGNARGVRSLFEQTLRLQARRIIEQDITHKSQLLTIIPDDIPGDFVSPSSRKFSKHKIVRIK